MLYGDYALSQNIPVAIPVTEQSLFLFIVYMKKQQYIAATITSYVLAIGYVHKLAGTNDPASSFLVKKSLQAIRKMQPSCDTWLPITEDILHLLVSTAGHAIHSMYRLNASNVHASIPCFSTSRRNNSLSMTYSCLM